MDHKDFHEAVREIAKGKYFSTTVEATTRSRETGSHYETTVLWCAYIDGRSWEGPTPEVVFAKASGREFTATTLDDIGESPEATAP